MTRFAHPLHLRRTLITCLVAPFGFGLIACTVQTDDGLSGDGPSTRESPDDQHTGGTHQNPDPDPMGSGGSSSSGGNTAVDGAGGIGENDGADPLCESGIKNNAETVCCPAACGFCGGTGCEDNPGGASDCCAGEIASSGVSCDEAVAPCVLEDPEGAGGGTGGSMGTGGGDSGACTLDTPVAGLPPYDFTMHNVLTKRMERRDFCDADKWYSEWIGGDGKPVQEFSLHQGDDKADYVAGGRSHQRCEFEEGLWATKGDGKWIEWKGRMLINKHPTDGSNGQKWHFRWGVYSNEIPTEATPLTNTVTELVVNG